MAEIEDRLVPCDGLNNYHVVLSRMDLPTHGHALFTFSVTESMTPVADLQVSVASTGQSLDRMTVEAHDALLDILRQLTFRAEKARLTHDRNARPAALPPAAQFPEAQPFADESHENQEFTLDRRAQPDRRARFGLDAAFAEFDAAE